MAGMNLHRSGTEPFIINLREPLPPPERHFRGDYGLIHDFVTEYGREALNCTGCGSRSQWRRRVVETWEKYEYVEFMDIVEGDVYDHAGHASSAEYYDEHDTERWECSSCGSGAPSRELEALLIDIDKETY